MLDLFHSFGAGLELFLAAIADNLWLSFWFIFAVAIAEAVFILGLFIPSTPILLLAGGLIAAGKLPFWEVYLAAVLGAIIGDAISYAVGYWLKDRIRTIWPFRDHLPLIDRGETFFASYGGMAVFIGRFVPGVKAVVPGVAGMFSMDYRFFSLINVTSAFVWAAAHLLPGMLLSAWLKSMGLSLEWIFLIGALLMVVLFVFVHRLAASLSRSPRDESPRD